ncbi:autoaggregation-mediating protein [Theileria orientalis]|uniref:ATP-dependent RNA helicase n=1 Tax=Theileria orientalis TaxID=68886 RepID=A0A976M3M8_THEOR|nr:autoaggregation-mediating protein [Theileria orientalis]
MLKEVSCFNNTTLRSESPLYSKYNVKLEKNKNAVSKFKTKSSKLGRKSRVGNRSKKMETLEELFATDNDVQKLMKEKDAYLRYTSELRNPIIMKIEHDNQLKSREKIKKLAMRAERKTIKYMKELMKKAKLKESKSLESSKSAVEVKKWKEKEKTFPDKNNVHETSVSKENEKVKAYKRSKITERELRSLPLKVPGIRALEPDSADVSVEEVESLIKLGYDGIVDMNSLFTEKSEMTKSIRNRKQADDNIELKELKIREKDGTSEKMMHTDKVSFESLGVYDKKLIETLKIKGISRATETQSRFIPELNKMLQKETRSKGANVKSSIIHASTGSGKTLAYMLPIFQSCYNESIPMLTQGSTYSSSNYSGCESPGYESTLMYTRKLLNEDILVICPSLELCVQSCNVAKQISEVYESMESSKSENNSHSEFSKVPGIDSSSSTTDGNSSSKNRNDLIRVKTEIKPTLLIGNANIAYQKKNIKKINGLKMEDCKEAKEVIERNIEEYMLSRGSVEAEGTVKRTVGMYFATPGRLYSILYKHKLLDISNFKYIVMDEYDSYLENKNMSTYGDGDVSVSEAVDGNIKNKQTRELIENMFNKLRNQNKLEDNEYDEYDEKAEEHKDDFSNLRRKYVVCVSASDNIEMMPEELREQFKSVKREKRKLEGELTVESSDNVKEGSKKTKNAQKSYDFPKNILHTMAIYSVPDAKLSLLRKILKSVPYNKSVLIFCDSNGTANFLNKYLSEIFKDASIELLNSVQNRLSRKKAFANVIQTNIDNTNLYNINKKTTRLVKDILISTRLNSRGIDFSGYTHVINYDLPHDTDSYIHKSGRIGRAGNPGICISLVESKNFPAFKRVIVDHLPLQFHKIEANNGLLVTKK